MSTKSKRSAKTRSSRKICQERRVCEGEKVEASFRCIECDTYQCCLCEESVHKDGDPFLHTRNRLEAPIASELCNYNSNSSCGKINYADVHCNECRKNFCFECDTRAHAPSKRSGHARVSFKKWAAAQAHLQAENIPSPSPDTTNTPSVGLTPSPNPAKRSASNIVVVSSNHREGGTPSRDLVASTGLTNKCDAIASVDGAPPVDLLEFDDEFISALPPSALGQNSTGSRPVSTSSAASLHHTTLNGYTPTPIAPFGSIPVDHDEFQSLEIFTVDDSLPFVGDGDRTQGLDVSSAPFRETPVSDVPKAETMTKTGGKLLNGGLNDIGKRPISPLQPTPAARDGKLSNDVGSRGHSKRGQGRVDIKGRGEPERSAVMEEDDYVDMNVDSDDRFGSLGSVGMPSLKMDMRDGPPEYVGCTSAMLMDGEETLQVSSVEDFAKKLSCPITQPVKVVSIFGNTGDGKSFTLNHTFFGGKEVFATSDDQSSCTVGIWGAYVPDLDIIAVDTEGLLGVTVNQNQRTRLLLKVLAISDVVVYRSRADRLHTDLFQFLGDASKAYTKHFTPELATTLSRMGPPSGLSHQTLGPTVIVFHETQHTNILGQGKSTSADAILRQQFAELGCDTQAFAAIKYVGTRTSRPPTTFSALRSEVSLELGNTAVRSPRHLKVIFDALTVLNEKFIGDIEKPMLNGFPDEYFTCTSKCLACGARCSLTVNHRDTPHSQPGHNCRYLHCYDNRVFVCMKCVSNGDHVVVVPKAMEAAQGSITGLMTYALSGYVLECEHCGVIYRSRQYWYGNKDPIDGVSVQHKVCHVWPGDNIMLTATRNAARQVLDGLGSLTDVVSSYSAGPSRAIGSWAADQVAPSYWVPNAQITHCNSCKTRFGEFDSKHHCRACGEGFCGDCTTNQKPVPERGWGPVPVRVCNSCYGQETPSNHVMSRSDSPSSDSSEKQVAVRKLVENVASTFGAVASVAIEMPREMIKDSARPSYWMPDHEISQCCVCSETFGPKLRIHHCRSCGKGVCTSCSPAARPVPSRGWDRPSRVCTTCYNKKGPL